ARGAVPSGHGERGSRHATSLSHATALLPFSLHPSPPPRSRPQVLEALYDRDIVSEEAVMAWADEKQFADAADKVFVERSAAFIKWLKEAEEEESDDE
ncbi:unnamed protein product, partial [Closterium sp. NIES-54]